LGLIHVTPCSLIINVHKLMASFLLLYLGFFNNSRCQVTKLVAKLSPLHRASLMEKQSLNSKLIKTFKICNIIKQILDKFPVFIRGVFRFSQRFSVKPILNLVTIGISCRIFSKIISSVFRHVTRGLPSWNIILKFYHNTRPVPFYLWIK
jgi:hypothetical protein